ncbi:threonine dehydrogenase-like Zn-dependent dehydrogenase [Enterovirga rhinocerotis]|uniref:Threonine dehydrogenase-like Zn-dependent dehydrogenase n=2 Tax=Enterovirga rhinocerotis TaxID=1339210 RepID=A0A4R7BVC8_9HYPH|nr:threonine dehydrogenase-like Zn-dependent dehydrogenase [Enterovirga rhinocerotis]
MPGETWSDADQASRGESAEVEAGSIEALWYPRAGEAVIRTEPLPSPKADEIRIRTLWTGLSRGTERLVFEGRVPETIALRMTAPAQAGSFSFPVKYGYCAVGEIEGETGPPVFALQPHQTGFVAARDAASPVPGSVPPRRAVLAANMETALNAVWDSGAGPGDRIAVVGAGVVGLLVAFLAARLPGAEVEAVDSDPARAAVAEALGARFRLPAEARAEADIVIHASGQPEGLALALSLAGHEAAVVEMSWYGDRSVPVPLGQDFHARRLRLVSSQVGEVAPSRRPRWSHARRLAKALALLADPRLDALITEEVAFADLPRELPRLLAPGAPGLCTVVRYETPSSPRAR